MGKIINVVILKGIEKQMRKYSPSCLAFFQDLRVSTEFIFGLNDSLAANQNTQDVKLNCIKLKKQIFIWSHLLLCIMLKMKPSHMLALFWGLFFYGIATVRVLGKPFLKQYRWFTKVFKRRIYKIILLFISSGSQGISQNVCAL